MRSPYRKPAGPPPSAGVFRIARTDARAYDARSGSAVAVGQAVLDACPEVEVVLIEKVGQLEVQVRTHPPLVPGDERLKGAMRDSLLVGVRWGHAR